MHRIITAGALIALFGATALVVPVLPSLAQSAPVQRPSEPDDVETAQPLQPAGQPMHIAADQRRAMRDACARFKTDRARQQSCLDNHPDKNLAPIKTRGDVPQENCDPKLMISG